MDQTLDKYTFNRKKQNAKKGEEHQSIGCPSEVVPALRSNAHLSLDTKGPISLHH
jgi:hypothetical protein